MLTLALQGDRAHHSVRAPTGLAGSVLQDSHTFLNARNSSEQAGLQLKAKLASVLPALAPLRQGFFRALIAA